MKRKITLGKLCLIASFLLGTMLPASAQEWLNYGKHIHGHPVSDETAHAFMQKYFGYKQDATVDTLYNFSKDVAPTDVAKDEMLLVEVNPYWRGVNRYPTMDSEDVHSVTTLVNGEPIVPPNWIYAKYAIKAVHKVGAPNITNNGKLYAYSGKLGRFYFAKRRETGYDNGAGKPQGNTLSRWYDEWSLLPPNTTAPSTYGWKNFGGVDHYMDFIKGAVYYAPHNCPNSLDINHYVSFINEGAEDSFDGYNATILFYISNVWDGVDTKGESVTENMPFMCMLRVMQDPTKVEKVAEEGGTKYYDITVTFNSSFTEAGETLQETDNETMWEEGTPGVREYFEIYRIDKDGNRVKVDEVPADQLSTDPVTGKYIYVDNNNDSHFPGEGATGTDYKYEITSNLYNVDENGNKVETTPIATAKSEQRPAHIPGEEAISLSINGETKCKYTPAKNQFGEGYNTFTHIIDTELLSDFTYEVGDVLELRQYLGTYTEESTPSWTKATGPFTESRLISAIMSTDEWKQIEYQFILKGGLTQDATYELVLKRKNEQDKYEIIAYSNRLTLSAYRADITLGEYAHRQGHPSGVNCPTTEVFHNELKFTPSEDGNIIYYAIVRNGDAWTGEVITQDQYKGFSEYKHVALYEDDIINDTEDSGFSTSRKPFFTNVAFDSKGNSYGSADVEYDKWTGAPEELVYYAKPSTEGQAVTTSASHNEKAFQPKLSLKLNQNVEKVAAAADVDPDLITSVRIMGIFLKPQSTEKEERELCSFTSMTEDLTLNYETEKYIHADPKYSDQWAIIKQAQDQYGLQSAEAMNAWADAAPKIWEDNMPTDIYIEVTYVSSSPQPTPPAPEQSVELNGMKLAPAKAISQNAEYKKYSNWAAVIMPPFGSMPITGIEEIAADNGGVTVYPTMTSDYVKVSGYTGEVVLVDLKGSNVKVVYVDGSASISVADLAKGVYVLKAGDTTEKIIVK